MCGDGETVYVVWSDTRNGAADIYFNRSVDGGTTWLEEDVRLDSGAPGAARSADPEICCDGEAVYVVWEDARNGRDDIYFNRSSDGGATWLRGDLRLDADAPGAAASGDPLVRCADGSLCVVWEDERDGQRDIYARRSPDGGDRWDAEAVVNTNGRGASFSDRPRIAVSGARVYVVWHDSRNGSQDIYCNASSDGGLTWMPADRRLDTDAPGAGLSYDPDLAADGERVYVVWGDIRSGGADVHANASADGGATWLATDVRLNTNPAGASYRPQVACDGIDAWAVWVDTRDGLPDIRLSRTGNGGASWLTADVRLDTDAPGAATSEYVKLAVQGERVVAVWEDDRDGSRDIRFNYSVDGGETFRAADLRLDEDPRGAAESVFPRLLATGRSFYVLWVDSRSGLGDVYGAPVGLEDDGGGTCGCRRRCRDHRRHRHGKTRRHSASHRETETHRHRDPPWRNQPRS